MQKYKTKGPCFLHRNGFFIFCLWIKKKSPVTSASPGLEATFVNATVSNAQPNSLMSVVIFPVSLRRMELWHHMNLCWSVSNSCYPLQAAVSNYRKASKSHWKKLIMEDAVFFRFPKVRQNKSLNYLSWYSKNRAAKWWCFKNLILGFWNRSRLARKLQTRRQTNI